MYITSSDLVRYLDPKRLRQLTDDDGEGSPDLSVIESAIAGGQGEVDAALGARYTVPLDPPPILITDITMSLTVYRLHLRRLPMPESVEKEATSAREMLEKIRAGDADLPTETEIAETADTSLASFGSADRVNTRDDWEDW